MLIAALALSVAACGGEDEDGRSETTAAQGGAAEGAHRVRPGAADQRGHDPLCAVHSLDHGVAWITYRKELPEDKLEVLRNYGEERYVLVSPYPGQREPVIATAWRNHLRLEGTDNPRLRQFVDRFRVTETAPATAAPAASTIP